MYTFIMKQKLSNVKTLVQHKGSDYDGSYNGTVTLSGVHEVTDKYRLNFIIMEMIVLEHLLIIF